MNKLLHEGGTFLWRALGLAPPLLWWTVAGIGLAGLNLLLPELWPHTPGAGPVLVALLLGCLLGAQWGVVITLERIRRTVRGMFWWACWSLAWLLGILGFAVLAAGCLVTVLIKL